MASALARGITYDIALIKLKNCVSVTKAVAPVELPRLSQTTAMFINQTATVCGLGIENTNGNTVSQYLQYTSLRVMSNKECASYFGTLDDPIMCAISSDNGLGSSCNGDSGSPLVVKENGVNVFAGVVSFGAASGCDKGESLLRDASS